MAVKSLPHTHKLMLPHALFRTHFSLPPFPASKFLPPLFLNLNLSYDRMKFQLPHLFLLLISILPPASPDYTCHDHQKSALLHFFSSSSLLSWMPHTDCYQWEGITCDPATGHVIAMLYFIYISNAEAYLNPLISDVGNTIYTRTYECRAFSLKPSPYNAKR